MTIRRADNDGNWMMFNGIVDFIDGEEQMKQNILTAIRCWKGNDFMNLDYGVDYINYLGAYNTEDLLRDNILKLVSSVDGVINVLSYEGWNDEDRKLHIRLSVETIYGRITVEDTRDDR